MHDPRIGRFFAVDPLTSKYPHYTPYSFSGNKVIHKIELEGLEEADPTLFHGTSVEGANGIIDKGFNSTGHGKYSNYNWFSSSEYSVAGGRGNMDIYIGVKGINVSNAHVITKGQTTLWKQNIMSEMGITGSDLKKLRKTDPTKYKLIQGEVYGKLYSKIGSYMDALGKDSYFLAKDGTWAVSDKLANQGTRVSFRGKITSLMRGRMRSSSPGETAAFSKAVPRTKGFSYAKFGLRSVIVVAVAFDVIEIYYSEDKSRTVTRIVYEWSFAAMGSAAAAALVGGQCGPQVVLPEEIITVPVAAVFGGIMGYFVGTEVHEVVYDFTFSLDF